MHEWTKLPTTTRVRRMYEHNKRKSGEFADNRRIPEHYATFGCVCIDEKPDL